MLMRTCNTADLLLWYVLLKVIKMALANTRMVKTDRRHKDSWLTFKQHDDMTIC